MRRNTISPSPSFPRFWTATLERSERVLAQTAQIDWPSQGCGNARVGQPRAASGNCGCCPNGNCTSRSGVSNRQCPTPVARVWNGNSDRPQIADGIGNDLLLSRGEGVCGRAAAAAKRSRVCEGKLACVEPRFVSTSSEVKKELFAPEVETTTGTNRAVPSEILATKRLRAVSE